MQEVMIVGGFMPHVAEAISEVYSCVAVKQAQEAVDHFAARHQDVCAVLMSLRMRDEADGCDAMEEMHEIDPDVPVIISTHETDVTVVVDVMRRGAYDYLYEPDVRGRRLMVVLSRAAAHVAALRENRRLHEIVERSRSTERFVGVSAATGIVLETLGKVAASNVPVLLIGESGTGKEVAARILHDLSPRSKAPFMPVNCGAFSPGLLDSELFGYNKGAFTGAATDHAGLFEQAAGGTLFLDEIGLTEPAFQVKLLRVLEEKCVRRMNDSRSRAIDTRIIAATNERLEDAVADGRFRHDLFYRLNVVPVEIPALRSRREDIPVLIQYFLDEFNRQYSRGARRISVPALECMEAYDWPGNVRELRNVIERAVLLGSQDVIQASDLPRRISGAGTRLPVDPGMGLNAVLLRTERNVIAEALRETGWNRAKAARKLKLKRTTLLAKIERLGLKPDGAEGAQA